MSDQTNADSTEALPRGGEGLADAPCSDLELARMLITHAVSSILSTCGNSYVNAYTEQWLDWALRLGAYHGPVIGNCQEVADKWEEYLENNGGLPEWPDSPHWLKRLGQNAEVCDESPSQAKPTEKTRTGSRSQH